ncbi:MAG: hypothetical protein ACHQWU_15785 [Gemmatimonadales bacterium]
MSIREVLRAPAMRVSIGVLAAAVAALGWSVVGALRVDPLPDPPPARVASLGGARGVRPPTDVQSAVENDVFSPDRSAPSAPYRMPGESAPSDTPVAEPTKPAVLGTVVATDGRSFATVQLAGQSPTLVHVGDKIGEWMVRAIERGKVVLVSSAGTRADVTVSKPGT